MQGLRIADLDHGHLAFDLSDLLALLDERVSQSDWLCLVAECIPADPDCLDLEEEYAASALTPGTEFLALARRTRQVIDGVFKGFFKSESEPWVTLQAVDSSYWEVFVRDPEDLAPFESRFRELARIEQSAA